MEHGKRDAGFAAGLQQLGLLPDHIFAQGGKRRRRIKLLKGHKGKMYGRDLHPVFPRQRLERPRAAGEIQFLIKGPDPAGGKLDLMDPCGGKRVQRDGVHRAGAHGKRKGPVFSVCHGRSPFYETRFVLFHNSIVHHGAKNARGKSRFAVPVAGVVPHN